MDASRRIRVHSVRARVRLGVDMLRRGLMPHCVGSTAALGAWSVDHAVPFAVSVDPSSTDADDGAVNCSMDIDGEWAPDTAFRIVVLTHSGALMGYTYGPPFTLNTSSATLVQDGEERVLDLGDTTIHLLTMPRPTNRSGPLLLMNLLASASNITELTVTTVPFSAVPLSRGERTAHHHRHPAGRVHHNYARFLNPKHLLDSSSVLMGSTPLADLPAALADTATSLTSPEFIFKPGPADNHAEGNHTWLAAFTLRSLSHCAPAFYATTTSGVEGFGSVPPELLGCAMRGEVICNVSGYDPALAALGGRGRGIALLGEVLVQYIIMYPHHHRGNTIAHVKSQFADELRIPHSLIGHRGLGSTMTSGKKLSFKLAENTLDCFRSAATRGLTFVEFDVMLTKDRVPIVFHDFYLRIDPKENSRDHKATNAEQVETPVHELTRAQLSSLRLSPYVPGRPCRLKYLMRKHWSDILDVAHNASPASTATPHPVVLFEERFAPVRLGGLEMVGGAGHAQLQPAGGVQASLSGQFSNGSGTYDGHAGAKKKKHADRSNPFRNPITNHIPSLKELFTDLPPSLGFNIEVKFPLQPETDRYLHSNANNPAFSLNAYVDNILDVVFRYSDDVDAKTGATRAIVFSSFSPDVCAAITAKQSRYHVLLLFDGTDMDFEDVRCQDFPSAMQFAAGYGLTGMCVNSALLKDPNGKRWIQDGRGHGLVFWTWGEENLDLSWREEQVAMGVSGMISDKLPGLTPVQYHSPPLPPQTPSHDTSHDTTPECPAAVDAHHASKFNLDSDK